LIVHSLELDNFKRFRSLRLELGEGLNVIKGPNESGKSTLIQALMALLYWKPNSRAADVLECSGWGGGEGFSLSALLESGDRSWSLSKDFSRHTALLEGNEGKVRDLDSIESWVAEETGLDSEGLYRSTACIGHEDIGELNRGKGELENGLQASVTGGRAGVSARKIIKAMAKDRQELERGTEKPVRNPGPLAAARKRLAALEKESGELERRVEQLRQERGQEKELREEKERLEVELASQQRIQDSFQERQELERELAELRERYAELSPLAETWERRDQLLRERRERFAGVEEALKDKGEWLERAAARRHTLQESMARLEEEKERLRGSSLKPPGGRYWLMALGALLVLAGIIGAFWRPWLAFLIAVGAVLLIVAARERKAREEEARRMAAATLDKQINDMRMELASLERSERELIGQVGAASVENFQEIKQSYFQLLDEQRDLENRLEALARGRNREEIEGSLRELAVTIQVKERVLKARRGEGIEPSHDQQAQVMSETLGARLKEVERELVRLQMRLEQGGDAEERLLGLEEEREALAEEIELLQRRARAYRLAEAWMEEALGVVVGTVKEKVQERVGELMASITDGRYSRVRMDGDFVMYAYSPEKGDEVRVDRLSRGTVDQVYLSARLALLESICGERRPPLLLDDPFVTFDRERIERSLSILKDFAREHQVLLFTCSGLYDAYADRLIELST
jgi:uncharacterized protein YhaN